MLADDEEATAEVHPGEIVTSRAPLEARDQRPKRSTPPTPKPPQRSRKVSDWSEWVFSAALAAIFLAFGSAILMDKEGRDLPRSLVSAPLDVRELHPNISDVVDKAPHDGALEITLVEASPMYPASVVAGFASDALVVLRRMREFFPEIENRLVRFVAKAPLHPTDTDSREMVPVLSLDFELSEVLEKVTAPEFTFQDLLNQTSAVQYLDDMSGPRYVGAFCRDPLSRSATDFCEREGGGG
ncbi:hypothetical protein VAR608DRAFT_3851 [Variovorax sp. HW608]|uniref:hypothetical protein n=1 Tax=Variovorax sp. HW608 TaxID=1034889 RepID=UPI00081F8C9E|nr:hypothetical protein [Variovorax sp. HW608]SCK40638.1 hypothetical protein VAR608DRAFT_3851 [Variovorax sp. HW608]